MLWGDTEEVMGRYWEDTGEILGGFRVRYWGDTGEIMGNTGKILGRSWGDLRAHFLKALIQKRDCYVLLLLSFIYEGAI